MIKNIIFDMGGVVFDDSASNLMQIFPNRNEEEINQIINMAFGRNFDKCDTGEKSISELISELKMKPGYEDAIYLLNPDHYNITFPIKMDVLEYIIDLKSRGYKLYILSNVSDESDKYINESIDIDSIFDGYLFSDKEHMHKPDVRFYNRLIDKYGLDKEETIFFDDRQSNVDVANNLGIKSYLFKTIEDTESVLNEKRLSK